MENEIWKPVIGVEDSLYKEWYEVSIKIYQKLRRLKYLGYLALLQGQLEEEKFGNT